MLGPPQVSNRSQILQKIAESRKKAAERFRDLQVRRRGSHSRACMSHTLAFSPGFFYDLTRPCCSAADTHAPLHQIENITGLCDYELLEAESVFQVCFQCLPLPSPRPFLPRGWVRKSLSFTCPSPTLTWRLC